MTQKRHQLCLTLELRDDEKLIREYEELHRPDGVWPEVLESISASGILDMQIYREGIRLIMILTVDDSFSFQRKAELDRNNPKVVEWEQLMLRFQNAGDNGPEDKWQPVRNIFSLKESS